MSKVLVTYATKTGSVSGIAETIGKTLLQAGAAVDVMPIADAPNPSAYDAVVVGSSVRMSRWHEPASAWVTGNATTLKSKPVALFTVGLFILEPDKSAEVGHYTDPMIAESGVNPVSLGLFPGWGTREKFGFAERLAMKFVKAPDGDKRDLAAVAAWAEGIAPSLGLGG